MSVGPAAWACPPTRLATLGCRAVPGRGLLKAGPVLLPPAVCVLLPGSLPSAYPEADETSLPLLQGSPGRCLCDGRVHPASPGTQGLGPEASLACSCCSTGSPGGGGWSGGSPSALYLLRDEKTCSEGNGVSWPWLWVQKAWAGRAGMAHSAWQARANGEPLWGGQE